MILTLEGKMEFKQTLTQILAIEPERLWQPTMRAFVSAVSAWQNITSMKTTIEQPS